MKKEIFIEPITRLEGHAKISIFLNEDGNVENAYFQVVELRGFEEFCKGRAAEDMPIITSRICGVCPSAHHMASTKALDKVFNSEPTDTAKKVRELFYCAHIIHSHIAHFFALASPDFVVGYKASKEKRNIFGVIEKVGLEIAKQVIVHRAYAQKIQEIIGGKATHPVCGLPGGISKPINEEEIKEIEKMAKGCVEFTKFSIDKIFTNVILKNKIYLDLIMNPDLYYHETYYMGMVDKNNALNFYDGDIRIVAPNNKEIAKYKPENYLDFIEETPKPWTYLKFPYLKKIGWKGLVDGMDSGIYRVNALARLNVADKIATPLAQEYYEQLYETFGKKPVHNTLAFHWARLIELVYASERLLELAQDSEITGKDVRADVGKPDEGVGVVEAPRGTLFHHYKTNDKGIIEKVNLVVATCQNHGAMCMSIKKAAQNLIKNWNVDDGLLNMIEIAFRAYDPCLSCATHSLPGHMPLEVKIFDNKNRIYKKLMR